MVEYASMRLRFVCAIATTLPTISVSTASAREHLLPVAPPRCPGRAPSRRNASAKYAIFGAVPMNSVTLVGAP